MAFDKTFLVLFVCAAVLLETVAGVGVYDKCNEVCTKRYADEVKASNMEIADELQLKIVRCIYGCMHQVNDRLREMGREDLVESPNFLKPFTKRTKPVQVEPVETEPVETEKDKESTRN